MHVLNKSYTINSAAFELHNNGAGQGIDYSVKQEGFLNWEDFKNFIKLMWKCITQLSTHLVLISKNVFIYVYIYVVIYTLIVLPHLDDYL